jgi:AraC-like DNA-binding protein
VSEPRTGESACIIVAQARRVHCVWGDRPGGRIGTTFMSWITSNPPGDSLSFKVLAPAPELRRWVRYYWVLKDFARSPQIDEYLAPDGFEEIIFSYAEGFRRQTISGSETCDDVVGGSYVVGTKTCGVACSRLGRLAMVGVKLWPQALHSLLRIPMHDEPGKPLHLGALNAPILAELEGRLFDADSESDVRSILDTGLRRALSSEVDDMLAFAINELFDARGAVGIDDITRRCGVHYRTLEKAFRQHIGIPPKALAKVLRFKNAFSRFSGDPAAGRLRALECGYYDQSHFCKEFKFFTGRSPTRFLRERLSVDVAKFCLDLDLRASNASPPADGVAVLPDARHERSVAPAQFLQYPRAQLP